MIQDDYPALILASKLGQSIGSSACSDLVAAASLQQWNSGSLIFQEGDSAEGMFLVVKGIVKLARITPDGRENVLTFVEPPGLFAEAAIFMGKYPVTAITLADSELLFLPRQRVFELISKHEAFMQFMFGTMASWLQRLVSKIDQLTLSDGTARVSRYLFSLLEKEQTTDYKIPRVTLPAKKGDLATMLNMNQPSLSRIFRRLQDDNVITVEGKTIYFNDLKALQNLAMPPLG